VAIIKNFTSAYKIKEEYFSPEGLIRHLGKDFKVDVVAQDPDTYSLRPKQKKVPWRLEDYVKY